MQKIKYMGLALSVSLAGCGHEIVPFSDSIEVLTEANHRAIVEMEIDGFSVTGHVVPERIICAEPSPDIAVAIELLLEVSADIRAPADQISGSGSLTYQQVETITELGRRLTTLQILRDGLYQSCQMYANGAIGSSAYATIIGGVDDLLPTLLAVELIGGGSRDLVAGDTAEAVSLLASGVERLRADLSRLEQEEAALPDDASDEDKQRIQRRIQARTDAIEALSNIQINLEHSSSEGNYASSIENIVSEYLGRGGVDSLLVACINALDRPATLAGNGLSDATSTNFPTLGSHGTHPADLIRGPGIRVSNTPVTLLAGRCDELMSSAVRNQAIDAYMTHVAEMMSGVADVCAAAPTTQACTSMTARLGELSSVQTIQTLFP